MWFIVSGDGKDLSDGQGAIAKRALRKYIDSGHDVAVEEDLAKGINFMGDLTNVLVILAEVVDKADTSDKKQIKAISDKHDFEFSDDGIVIRRYSGIGTGKLLQPDTFNQTARCQAVIVLPGDRRLKIEDATERQCRPTKHHIVTKKDAFFPTDQTVTDDQMETDQEEDDEMTEEQDGAVPGHSKLFSCPEERCTREYLRYRDLQNHISSGKHKIPKKTEETSILAKTMYFDQFEDGNFVQFQSKGGRLITNLEKLEEVQIPNEIDPIPTPNKKQHSKGFALKLAKSSRALSPRVKAFVAEKFRDGAITGFHERALQIHEAIQDAKNLDGSPMFDHTEYLSIQQITSLFSNLSKMQKKRGIAEVDAGDDERDPNQEAEDEVTERREAVKRIKLAVEKDVVQGHPFTVIIVLCPVLLSLFSFSVYIRAEFLAENKWLDINHAQITLKHNAEQVNA